MSRCRWNLPAVLNWLERIDAGGRRRIKGIRVVISYAIAALLTLGMPTSGVGLKPLAGLAGGFALWASVSENGDAPARDLAMLVAAAGAGAVITALLTPVLRIYGAAGPELTLVSGAFAVGYLKGFGVLGSGLGSQIYIGQLLAYSAGLDPSGLPVIASAVVIALPAAIGPRLLIGWAERSVSPASPVLAAEAGRIVSPALAMGLQAATAASTAVFVNGILNLTESAWAITASTYVVAANVTDTARRVRGRIVGTAIGVPLGLAAIPLAVHAPILIWAAAALAIVIYIMALPERYDIASGAFAFSLIVTLAASGEHSVLLLASRLWETMLGGTLGLGAAFLIFPVREKRSLDGCGVCPAARE